VLVDGTDVNAVSAALAERFTGAAWLKISTVVSTGIYNLMWDLAKRDIAAN
jgi:hypothetical protein